MCCHVCSCWVWADNTDVGRCDLKGRILITRDLQDCYSLDGFGLAPYCCLKKQTSMTHVCEYARMHVLICPEQASSMMRCVPHMCRYSGSCWHQHMPSCLLLVAEHKLDFNTLVALPQATQCVAGKYAAVHWQTCVSCTARLSAQAQTTWLRCANLLTYI